MSRRVLGASFGVTLGLACVSAVLWDRGDLLAYAPLVVMAWCLVTGYRPAWRRELPSNLVELRPRSMAHAENGSEVSEVSEVSEERAERTPSLAGRA
jgi:hypothetical protein